MRSETKGFEGQVGGDASPGDGSPRCMQPVSLVGAGPGDPDLLTIRAWHLLRAADVVVHDKLVGPGVLALIPPGVRRIDVGKASGNHALPQPAINQLLVDLARQGLRVVRLKGGDPTMFGRGGEEAEHLVRHGVGFQMVPGVTAASAAGALAGIPLTHRSCAHACLFVTAHLCSGEDEPDWTALTRPNQTLVVYMGLARLDTFLARLVAHGLAAELPAAAIERASYPSQRVVEGTLGSLAERVRAAALETPTLVIVGEVVRLRELLSERALSVPHQTLPA